MDYDLTLWISFYLGACFLGLFAWESANAIRKQAPFLLLLVCIALAISPFIIMVLFPFRLNYYGFILTRAPFFLTVLIDVVLFWNLILMRSPQAKAPFKVNIGAGVSLILIVWIFATAIPDFSWIVFDYGQMVSFFVLTIPTVLAWEALMDVNPFVTGKNFKLIVGGTFLVIVVSLIAGFQAILLGGVMWAT